MKRRILLVLTTLAALLGAFYVYTLVAGREGLDNPREPNTPVLASPTTTPAGEGTGPVRDAQDVEIIARDERGRLQGRYQAALWDRRADGAQVLTKPRVELYQKDGRQIILRADKAELYGQELNRGINVRRARLSGNVTIYFDPSRQPERLPVEQRPDEVVRVHVEEVDFDREHLTITTDKRVTVFSPEADIYGRGMTISWNESPRELLLLRIEHGEYMAVYNVPAELDMIALPGKEPTTAPLGGPRPAASAPAASAPTASQPATDPNKPLPRNQYQAQFHDGVKVIHRNRRLSGADVLTLKFDWDDSWRKDSSSDNIFGLSRRNRRGEGVAPASGPATAPSATTQPASLPAAVPSATTRPGQGAEPMEIYWTGPLVIVPTGRTETPSRGTYDLLAEGKRVVLTDARATVLCRRFSYQHPRRSGWLEGGPGLPVRLLLSEGADVACDRIDFDRATGNARLHGAGHMARRFPNGLSQTQAVELIETDDPDLLPASERITWAKGADLKFTDEAVTRNGKTTTRQFIQQADFHQGVVLRESADPNGDAVECDDLAVAMGHNARGSSYLKTAVAIGNVRARQEGANISAGKVTVDFVEDNRPRAARSAPAAGDLSLASGASPSRIVAEGGVAMTNRSDPNAELLTASADRMVSELIENDLSRRTAVLTGRLEAPARIEQGSNKLIGREIRLDQTDDSAAVDGAGTLDFVTKKDASGNDLPEPRAVKVQWAKSMNYSGKKRTAEFTGDVTLDSALDDVRCQELQLVFTDQLGEPNQPPRTAMAAPPAGAPVAASPAGGSAKDAVADTAKKPAVRGRASSLGGMAVSMEQYNRRRISMIFAEKDIVLRSRREDEKNRLVRRMQLAGEKLIYDAESERITMLGRGTLMSEDYDKPRPPKAAADGSIAAVDRPSQSAFAWNKSMVLSQKDRVVTLEGGVIMDHRSGDQIVGKDKLNVPRDQWGTLPAGRKTRLECDTMTARFGEPVNTPATQPSTRPARRSGGDPLREGPTMGPLDLFSATGDVSLKDGPRHVLAQRLIYNRDKDLAVVWGFLEGKPPAKGSITYEDPQTGRTQTVASPKFIWYRRDNRIFSEDVSATGGR